MNWMAHPTFAVAFLQSFCSPHSGVCVSRRSLLAQPSEQFQSEFA
ncbi:hypothetical protein KL86DES1_20299 [uncultured Desulfovibrio sp.]|uniref:Uncharacterized protein n=1 Tax=uncultured Desulfovibrio sp. TaxID=167968 RepID=A0A212L309_9BACT|nr:hypothetical protein KL86DES1_20299 [uncultured Desulfovibrio sp.]VZH33201.1 conserved protein of unknown function [Desulfovibrio sp. 86]